MNRREHLDPPSVSGVWPGFRRAGRRGLAAAQLLVGMAVVGGLAVTATVVTPRLLHADHSLPGLHEARQPEHQLVIEGLAALLGRAVEVVAIHPRGDSPYEEIIVWLEDSQDTGTANAQEVVVISHSRVLQTITMSQLPAGFDDRQADPLLDRRRPPRGKRTFPPAILTVEDLESRDFCGRWRTAREMVTRVLATDVSEMRIRDLQQGDSTGALVGIELTWAGRTADTPDSASVAVHVALRPSGGKE